MLVLVLRSPKKMDTYLYVPKDKPFTDLPEQLQQLFSPQSIAMTLFVKPEKQLARLSGDELLEHLQTTGYYLQLPPRHDEFL